jgi:ABC-type dipeptide/oligopeptide/nickel transport system permease subunit
VTAPYREPTSGLGTQPGDEAERETALAPNAGAALGAETPPPEGGEVMVLASGWKLAVRSFLENKLAVVGLLIVVLMVLFCFVGPVFYHGNIYAANPANSDLAPGGAFPLGTDTNGFDILAQLMHGGQESLEVGFLAAAIATVIGTIWGAVAGLAGGVVDMVMMRIVDVLLAIPFLFIVLILATKFSATVVTLSIVLGIFSWLVPSRLVRGEVLTLRTRDFIAASKVMGATQRRQAFRHLIPNALSVVIVNVTFQVADAILALAFLGFLGFGLTYPHVDWGDMLSNAEQALSDGYWWQVYPVGFCLVIVIMAINFIGDALRDAFDVRLRRR